MRSLVTGFFLLFILPPVLCQEKMPSPSGEGRMIVSAAVIEKEYVNPRAKSNGRTDLYLRLSMNDYFIKFCESAVSEKDIRPFIADDMEDFKVIRAEVELRQGNWDQCSEEIVQSRTGDYIVIHKIIKQP